MPVRNEERFITDTLQQLLGQDYPADRFEVIVADGMSDDATRKIVTNIATQHPQVRLLDNPRQRSSAGRNIGFKNGNGDIFLVVDGHCFIPDNQLLKNTAACLEKSGAACLGRPQPLDPPGLTEFQKAVALARASKLGHGGDSLIFGQYEGFASPVSNGATYRKEVFEKAGYLDEAFDACEDVEFNYRVEQAGCTCYTSPKLTVRYYPRENLQGLMRQMQRYGSGRRRFTRKHPKALTLNQLIPAGFVVGILSLGVTVFLSLGIMELRSSAETSSLRAFVPSLLTLVTTPLLLLYALYLLIIIVESIRIAAKNGWQYLRWMPFIIVTIHFGLGWGFVRQAFSDLAPLKLRTLVITCLRN
jgi:cellulose synthase/poly-beta-1,6-N-acetylglucosamine synthase-like glycosyltransferase